MITWIIGISGSGKSTLSRDIVNKLRKKGKSVILLDGDEVRELYNNDLSHSIKDRKINADRICKLCKFFDEQHIDVVCAILSIFPESRKWNRENYNNYFEIFIDSPVSQCVKRDSKGIYSNYYSGKIKNVAGLDLEFNKPSNPNLIIKNNKSLDYLLSFSDEIVENYI
tara:strand:+ start:1895 stop:2398 length:504 start_codon:yes stop_codon:yes gene_type:complete